MMPVTGGTINMMEYLLQGARPLARGGGCVGSLGTPGVCLGCVGECWCVWGVFRVFGVFGVCLGY